MNISGTTSSLNCITFPSRDTGYVCGNSVSILRTTNGGTTWQSLNFGAKNLFFLNSKTGYAVSGQIYKTTNAGINWFLIGNGLQSYNYLSVYFQNEQTGFSTAQGSKEYYIFKTTNGGLNWTRPVYSAGWSPSRSDFYFIDQNTGYALEAMYKTTNQGTNWFYASSETSMHFFNMNTGIDVGGSNNVGIIRKTTDQGLHWTIFENQNPGTENFRIRFTTPNNGYIISAAGKIRYTSDGGLTWVIQNNPFNGRPNISLRGIDFIDQNTGFIVGDSGVVLKTSNGGLTFSGSNNTEIPNEFILSQNYPNPFNPSTKISFLIASASFIELKLFDMNGKLLKILESNYKSPGNYNLNLTSDELSSGVYYYSLLVDGVILASKKAIVLK